MVYFGSLLSPLKDYFHFFYIHVSVILVIVLVYEWNSRPICIHYSQRRHIAYDISDGDVVRQKQRKNNVCLYLYEWNS
jgi:hypothetical protein